MALDAGAIDEARGRFGLIGDVGPPHLFHQQQVLTAARDILSHRYPQFETLSSIFANTGVINGYGVKPLEWYFEQRSWPERTLAFLEGAEALFIDVARKAIGRTDLTASDTDTVVTVCSTEIATPSLEARIAGKIGFRSDDRVYRHLGWAARAV